MSALSLNLKLFTVALLVGCSAPTSERVLTPSSPKPITTQPETLPNLLPVTQSSPPSSATTKPSSRPNSTPKPAPQSTSTSTPTPLPTPMPIGRWSTVKVPGIDSIKDMQFTDLNTGWVVASSGLIRHTTDGGLTWEIQDKGKINYPYLFMLNQTTGWISDLQSATLLRTTDGGKNWRVTDSGLAGMGRMVFFNESQGFAQSGRSLYQTNDGGNQWQKVAQDGPEGLMAGLAPGKLICGDVHGGALYLFDGTWKKVSPASGMGTAGITLQDSSNIWAWGYSDQLYRSTSGGQQFTKLTSIIADTGVIKTYANNVQGVAFANSQEGLIIIGNQTYVTRDGGENWLETSAIFPGRNLTSIKLFGSTNSGWGLSTDGELMRLKP